MRVKTGFVRRKKHKKTLALAKGYRMARHKLYKTAHEAVLHAGQYAYMGRKLKKRQMRRLWIVRLSAALSNYNLNYSQFINRLKRTNIILNRKVLSNLAVSDPKVFEGIVRSAK